MPKQNILATIITFNPDIDILKQNITAILPQVDKLIIFDNNSVNIEQIKLLLKDEEIVLITSDINRGVAGPLHDAINMANKLGYKYFLSLDQDSIASETMIVELYETLIKHDAAMVGPQLIDSREVVADVKKTSNIMEDTEVEEIITSGALADVEKILSVGNYIEEMVIDWVDFEICRKLTINGFKILISAKAKLNHRQGNPKVVRFLFRNIHPSNYSPFRLYYQSRNIEFCNMVFKNKKWYKKDKRYIKNTIIKIIFAEDNKLKKLKAIFKGFKDAKLFYNEILIKNNKST